MAALPYIQLYVADYLADTAHLSVTASGVYLHLIMNYWQTGKPLIHCDQRLAMIGRCFNGEWAEVKDSVLEFFEQRDGKLHHKRIDAELAKIATKGICDPELGGEWKGYVYFISPQNSNKVKIGYSKNPWARLKDLQISSSEKLLLVATVKTTECSEKNLHKELSEYLISGEWFLLSPMISDLIKIIKDKKITTVDESINYCRNYDTATVETTKDTDTDTDTNLKNIKKNHLIDFFERLKKIYPRKENMSRAEKLLKKINPDVALQEKILSAVCTRLAIDKDFKFWPHLSTWLNGKQWNDEITGGNVVINASPAEIDYKKMFESILSGQPITTGKIGAVMNSFGGLEKMYRIYKNSSTEKFKRDWIAKYEAL